MKNYSKDVVATAVSIKQVSKNSTKQVNLYVAYRNNDMIECYGMGTISGKVYENGTRNYRASVFSTTGGKYYIDGVPAMLSQNDEAMLYEGELAEYY